VLSVTGTFGAAMAARYEDGTAGTNPKIASIYAPSTYPNTTNHEAMTLVEGFRIQSLGTWKTLTTQGTIQYFQNVIANLYASLNCATVIVDPVGVGDMPNNPLPYYLALRSANPVREAPARIAFSIAVREKVELRLYDTAGRLVRTLANREFTPGEHDVTWDGLDDGGRPAPAGIYFYQMRTPSFVSQKKLAVLKR
jgi:flagellar hook capping protein FlgD